jgi:hypothetical protein
MRVQVAKNCGLNFLVLVLLKILRGAKSHNSLIANKLKTHKTINDLWVLIII